MQRLRYHRHEVVLIQIMHHDELEFEFDGMVKFDGMELKEHLLTRPHLIRPSYLRAVEAYMKELREGCEANRVDYVLMDTSRPLEETLTSYLARRLRIRRI